MRKCILIPAAIVLLVLVIQIGGFYITDRLCSSASSAAGPVVPQEHNVKSSSNETPCLNPAYHHLCFSFHGDDVTRCHQNPESFLKEDFSKYRPSLRELEARDLMSRLTIRNLSIGSSTSGKLCNDVVKQATVCTDRPDLDLFKINSWLSLFLGTNGKGLDVVFAEHVLEHFTPTQVQKIAAASFVVLKPGGVFRIAVPDGYKPSPSYQLYVRAGKTASGLGQNHMVSWTIDTLPALFREAGFEILERENYSIDGTFQSPHDSYDQDSKYGIVRRSSKADERNTKPYKDFGVLSAADLGPDEPMITSLWFDAVKPSSCHHVLEMTR